MEEAPEKFKDLADGRLVRCLECGRTIAAHEYRDALSTAHTAERDLLVELQRQIAALATAVALMNGQSSLGSEVLSPPSDAAAGDLDLSPNATVSQRFVVGNGYDHELRPKIKSLLPEWEVSRAKVSWKAVDGVPRVVLDLKAKQTAIAKIYDDLKKTHSSVEMKDGCNHVPRGLLFPAKKDEIASPDGGRGSGAPT